MRFGAANYAMELFINGVSVGKHFGGYTAFSFDITPYIQYGKCNHIAVRVSNAKDLNILPLHADFTFFGGLTREVAIIKENNLHITNEDYGSSGVFVKQEKVSREEAVLVITTKVRNTNRKAQKAVVTATVKDREGKLVKNVSSGIVVAAGETLPVVQNLYLSHPHLWDGTNDPYLYRTEVTVSQGREVMDSSVQPLGLRFYHIDSDKGFFLNGHPYPLRGVCLHEQVPDKGNALSDADRKRDLDMVNEIGANYVRLSHYQHGDYTYNYLDTLGIVCWTEEPLIDSIKSTKFFTETCETVMRSLIRQQYNHPSVIVWGLSNEINFYPGPNPLPLIKHMNNLTHEEDPTRPAVLAAMHHEKPTNFVPDAFSINPYYGWYYGKAEDFGPSLDRLHKKYPKANVGISEYGAGAHPFQQQEGLYVPATTGHWHPENVQTNFHEVHLRAINERPYLWSTSVWAMFDFASDGRFEGNQPGINDKGLVTHDRRIKKDAFYLYRANWNSEPMVHICNKRFIKRDIPQTRVKVYSNCDQVKLLINQQEQTLIRGDLHIYQTDTLTLKKGTNTIEVIAVKDDREYKDKAIWYYIEPVK